MANRPRSVLTPAWADHPHGAPRCIHRATWGELVLIAYPGRPGEPEDQWMRVRVLCPPVSVRASGNSGATFAGTRFDEIRNDPAIWKLYRDIRGPCLKSLSQPAGMRNDWETMENDTRDDDLLARFVADVRAARRPDLHAEQSRHRPQLRNGRLGQLAMGPLAAGRPGNRATAAGSPLPKGSRTVPRFVRTARAELSLARCPPPHRDAPRAIPRGQVWTDWRARFSAMRC